MPEKKCTYVGCEKEVRVFESSKFCIFHAPKEKEEYLVEDFEFELIARMKDKKDYDFTGFICSLYFKYRHKFLTSLSNSAFIHNK